MKLCVINTSEGKKESPLKVYIDHFLRGFTTECSTNFDVIYDISEGNSKTVLKEAETIIVAFDKDINDKLDSQLIMLKEISKLINDDLVSVGFIVLTNENNSYPKLNSEAKEICAELNCHFSGLIQFRQKSGIGIFKNLSERKMLKTIYKQGILFGKSSELVQCNKIS